MNPCCPCPADKPAPRLTPTLGIVVVALLSALLLASPVQALTDSAYEAQLGRLDRQESTTIPQPLKEKSTPCPPAAPTKSSKPSSTPTTPATCKPGLPPMQKTPASTSTREGCWRVAMQPWVKESPSASPILACMRG